MSLLFPSASDSTTAPVPSSVMAKLIEVHSSFAEDKLLNAWKEFMTTYPNAKDQQITEFIGENIRKQDYAIFLRRLGMVLEILKFKNIKLFDVAPTAPTQAQNRVYRPPHRRQSFRDIQDPREAEAREAFRSHRNLESHCFDTQYLRGNYRTASNAAPGRVSAAGGHSAVVLQQLLSMRVPADGFLWQHLFSQFREDDYVLATLDCAIVFQGFINTGSYGQERGGTTESFNDHEKFKIFHQHGFNTQGWIEKFKLSDHDWFAQLHVQKIYFQEKNDIRFKIKQRPAPGFVDKPAHFLWFYHNVYKVRDKTEWDSSNIESIRDYHFAAWKEVPNKLPLSKWTTDQWKTLLNIPLGRLRRTLRNPAYDSIHCLWSQVLWNQLVDELKEKQAARGTQEKTDIEKTKEKEEDEQISLIHGFENDLDDTKEVFFTYARQWGDTLSGLMAGKLSL